MGEKMDRYRLVLVGTRTPGNVGACARVAANFGIRDWVIVDPQCSWDGWDARKLATGAAAGRLPELRVAASVAEAVQDCQAAIGFTRRFGKIRAPSIGLGGIAPELASLARIALVFGNEETGLSREELEPCTHLCAIPTSAEMGSMNLSHAVAVVSARLYEQESATRKARGAPSRRAPARLAEFEAMLQHWREFLVDIGLVQAGNPERILGTLRRAFERAGLTPQELRAIRGVLSKAQVRLGTRRRGRRIS